MSDRRAAVGGLPRASAVAWARIAGAVAELSAIATAPSTPGDDGGAEPLLAALCRAVADSSQVDGVGVMRLEPTGRLAFVDAVPARITGVERLQETHQRGPCRVCADHGVTLVVDDLRADHRWPELAAGAKRSGLVSMAAIPLLARDRPWGVLDLYRRSGQPWTEQDLAEPRLLAQLTASYLALAAERDAVTLDRDDFEHRATHDHLTGLPNRGLLFNLLEHATLTAARRGTTVAVLFLDIDHFKSLNDSFGHAFGDLVLVEVAKRLRAAIRASDTLTRLSGDEFVVICEDLTGAPASIRLWIRALGRRIQHQLRTPGDPTGPHDDPASAETVVSASIGAALSTDTTDMHVLLHRADRAMYRAKDDGGGRLVIHTPHLQLAPTLPTHLDTGHTPA